MSTDLNEFRCACPQVVMLLVGRIFDIIFEVIEHLYWLLAAVEFAFDPFLPIDQHHSQEAS